MRLMLLLALSGVASGSPITWYLQGVHWNDVATPGYSIGQFTYDAETNAVTAWSITDLGSELFFPSSWRDPAVLDGYTQSPTSIHLSGVDSGSGVGHLNYLQLVLTAPLTDAGGTIPLVAFVDGMGTANTWEGYHGGFGLGFRYLEVGSVSTEGPSAAPEPSTFYGVLVALGAVACRTLIKAT